MSDILNLDQPKGVTVPPNLSVFNLPEALNRAMGDGEFLHSIFKEFLTAADNFISQLEGALRQGDFDKLGKIAHQFKGAAANLSAPVVAAAALELESMGKQRISEGTDAALERLKAAVEKLKAEAVLIDWRQVGQT
jgi:HPt (histidine-containing phosphotransfer) domain-containing protein